MTNTPYQTALDRIRQAADSGAESLDLSNLGLTSLLTRPIRFHPLIRS